MSEPVKEEAQVGLAHVDGPTPVSPATRDASASTIAVEGKPDVRRSISDCLAVERTVLANERTLLAYFRSSLAVLVVAVTIIKFFTSQGMIILGYLLLVVGVLCLTFGLMRFTDMHQRIKDIGRCDDKTS